MNYPIVVWEAWCKAIATACFGKSSIALAILAWVFVNQNNQAPSSNGTTAYRIQMPRTSQPSRAWMWIQTRS